MIKTMIKFIDIVYETIVEESAELIKEGGNAIAGVDRIQLSDIEPTVKQIIYQYLEPVFGKIDYESDEVFLLGSTGKKESSGDLDIGYDLTYKHIFRDSTVESKLGELYEFIKESGNNSVIINQFTGDMIHFGFPQYDKNNELINKTVQVDILITVHPEFCRFYMYSPSSADSMYKGAHRNDLLRSIAKIISYQVLDGTYDDPLQWVQFDLTSNGMVKCVKTLIDEYGNKLKWNGTDEDLEIGYAKNISEKLISSDPKEVIRILVGDYDEDDISTFEDLFDIIKFDNNFKFSHKKDEILHEAAKLIHENNRLEFPKMLEEYL